MFLVSFGSYLSLSCTRYADACVRAGGQMQQRWDQLHRLWSCGGVALLCVAKQPAPPTSRRRTHVAHLRKAKCMATPTPFTDHSSARQRYHTTWQNAPKLLMTLKQASKLWAWHDMSMRPNAIRERRPRPILTSLAT